MMWRGLDKRCSQFVTTFLQASASAFALSILAELLCQQGVVLGFAKCVQAEPRTTLKSTSFIGNKSFKGIDNRYKV
ncbi:MAG: hypothetical protein EZS28_030843 [Streblomastix strix]|uniref:Uncharacterized protein n=1 Tax=Streblomastix strix TaxID=222440 RepID=A0A5J4UUA9_9EUKA|nr:MAG: hypothetical protein EZS28_030843 [Streblomastix strix]